MGYFDLCCRFCEKSVLLKVFCLLVFLRQKGYTCEIFVKPLNRVFL